jgi:23S rRNA pseudouridine2605 synthase
VRLQKYLSRAGVASRRAAERMIRDGRVRVNADVVREMGVRVETEDRVYVDGREVSPEAPVWVILNKPPGYVTTRDDPRGRPTVYDLLPARFESLFHVGRLDMDSEGLLLLTNEGGVANRLMHPSGGVDRVYRVDVEGTPSDGVLARLLAGVELEDGRARVHAVELLAASTDLTEGSDARLVVVMREGRKREVRRLMDAVGHPVRRLVRERLGPVALGELPAGEWRELTAAEVEALRAV